MTTLRSAYFYLDTSETAMFGSETPPENSDDLRRTFVAMVKSELAERFPEIDIDVIEVEHGQRVVFHDDPQANDDATADAIMNAAGRIYANANWYEVA